MAQDIENIPGFSLFKTKVEQERLVYLLKFVQELIPEEKIKHFLPNMVKDPEGKITINGFCVLLDTIIVEFRNFLNAVDFDFAKYEIITNIRLEIKDFGADNLPTETSMATLKIYHTAISNFTSSVTVFGKEPCNYIYEVTKNLRKLLK